MHRVRPPPPLPAARTARRCPALRRVHPQVRPQQPVFLQRRALRLRRRAGRAGAAATPTRWTRPALDFDLLFGPAYKGIPLATALACEYARRGRDLPLAFNRKEAKAHGEGGSLIGAPLAGRRVLIVDDVITAGTAIREALAIIREAGGTPAGIVIALDRQEARARGRRRIRGAGGGRRARHPGDRGGRPGRPACVCRRRRRNWPPIATRCSPTARATASPDTLTRLPQGAVMPHQRHILRAAVAALALAGSGVAAAQAAAPPQKKIYCWDEGGRRVCGDALPAAAVDSARDRDSAPGAACATGQVDRALTDAESSVAASRGRSRAPAGRGGGAAEAPRPGDGGVLPDRSRPAPRLRRAHRTAGRNPQGQPAGPGQPAPEPAVACCARPATWSWPEARCRAS